MSFLCLKDLTVNMEDIVLITPRWETMPYDVRTQISKKVCRGSSFFLRGRDTPMHSEVSYEEIMKEVKLVLSHKS